MAAGVDLFEAFYPFQVTERGAALCFSFDIGPDPERAGGAPRAGVANGSGAKSSPFQPLDELIDLFQHQLYSSGIYSVSRAADFYEKSIISFSPSFPLMVVLIF